LAPGTGPHYLEETHEDSYALPRGMLLMMMIRMMEVVVTTGAIRRAKLKSNRYHQQTNTHLLTDRMPFLLHNQQR